MITYNTLFRFASSLAVTALLVSASQAETITMYRAPVPVIAVTPDYPDELRMRDLTGEALVEFTIDEEGNVSHVEVKSATYSDFALAARRAIRSWKFEPPQKMGRPVSIRTTKRFDFVLRH